MTAHERYVRALREAADAYEEANCGKKHRPRKPRGLLPLDGPREIPPDIEAKVEARLVSNGYRHR